jgi:choline-sulfatase
MSDQPNVLLITTDHWPAALLGCAGHPVVQTPTLDELARCGTRFTNAYAECPVCIPARRTLMTGVSPRRHRVRDMLGDPMSPDLPTLAQTFRTAGYQCYAAGKLHVFPQRDRIGFDDVILCEEGRTNAGVVDDYELFLGDEGYAGQQFAHGMGNNQYVSRPWHLPEYLHVTNWLTRQMSRAIERRDPTRPGFWYLSYTHPHPPLAPLQAYLDLYRDVEIDTPYCGDWAADREALPWVLESQQPSEARYFNEAQVRAARRAFYALCTHIDHQLRVVIGTLREAGLLDNTIILFSSDHGDMLGNHGLWRKRAYYENSANVPMILLAVQGDDRVGVGQLDERIVGWQDVMPTLCDLAGVSIPDTVEGLSMAGDKQRGYLYGEVGEDVRAARMIRDERYKLIYYPAGNRVQLFDLQEDPLELRDLSAQAKYSAQRERLTAQLIAQFYGGDEAWAEDEKLIGLPSPTELQRGNRGLSGQRGLHWSPPLHP